MAFVAADVAREVVRGVRWLLNPEIVSSRDLRDQIERAATLPEPRAEVVSAGARCARVAAGLASIVRLVPGDFANWSTQDELSTAPERFDVKDRTAVAGVYCFANAQEFACAPVGITQPLTLIARRSMTVSLHQILSGVAGTSRSLAPGAVLSIPAVPPAFLIRGRLN